MKSEGPLVSILIPCHNAQSWIAQCIGSALSQTWPLKEVIVVDDGSTDDSLAVIQSFGERIRWETGPNRGGNAARNRLLELAQGDWLQYLDADDYLWPDKIEKQVRFAAGHPELDVVFSRYVLETSDGDEVRREVGLIPEPLDPWELLVRWDLPQTGAVLSRRQAVLDVGGWRENQPCCQEHKLYLRLLRGGKQFGYCPDYGAVYRQWNSGSVSTRSPAQVHQWRIDIIAMAEEHLRSREELTTSRLWAINQARLEIARLVWQYDRDKAREIARRIHQSLPAFRPGGPGRRVRYSFPYRLSYRLFGFAFAEKLAQAGRNKMGNQTADA